MAMRWWRDVVGAVVGDVAAWAMMVVVMLWVGGWKTNDEKSAKSKGLRAVPSKPAIALLSSFLSLCLLLLLLLLLCLEFLSCFYRDWLLACWACCVLWLLFVCCSGCCSNIGFDCFLITVLLSSPLLSVLAVVVVVLSLSVQHQHRCGMANGPIMAATEAASTFVAVPMAAPCMEHGPRQA
jgi:hypothetical protein